MAKVTIPITAGIPNFRQRTALDGREYVFVFRWSQREGKFYFDLLDADEALLAGSVKVTVNIPLLKDRIAARPEMPQGVLMAIDGRGQPDDPGLDEFGDDGGVVALIYQEAA